MNDSSTNQISRERTAEEPSPATGRFELQAGLKADMITMVRQFIESLYARLLGEEIAYRIGLAAHELMDNAVRCASRGNVKVRVEVTDEVVIVHTENRAKKGDIANLERMIDEMRDHTDPLAYYAELMSRTATSKHVSGLGLARIWAEADMTLSYETHADLVSICAQIPLSRCRV